MAISRRLIIRPCRSPRTTWSATSGNAWAAGAREFHIHVRDASGHSTLEPEQVNRAAVAVRTAGAHAAGVTTLAGIEPRLQRRLILISKWTTPDYSSVNLCEEGAVEVMRRCLRPGSASRQAYGQPRTPRRS